MSDRKATAALLTLAGLLLAEAALPFVQVAIVGREYLQDAILTTILGGTISAALFYCVCGGTSSARITLTALSGLGVMALGVTLFLNIRSPALAITFGLGILVRVAVIVLLNTEPIKTMAPEPASPAARPIKKQS